METKVDVGEREPKLTKKKETERERERERDRQTDRQTDKDRKKQRQRETERQYKKRMTHCTQRNNQLRSQEENNFFAKKKLSTVGQNSQESGHKYWATRSSVRSLTSHTPLTLKLDGKVNH